MTCATAKLLVIANGIWEDWLGRKSSPMEQTLPAQAGKKEVEKNELFLPSLVGTSTTQLRNHAVKRHFGDCQLKKT